ncbi:hypothetical protein D3C79_576020 [compost metagenome]
MRPSESARHRGLGAYPVDEGLDLGALAVGERRHVVTLLAAHLPAREGLHQLVALQPLAHQVLAAHGHPGVIHGGDDGEIGAIETHARLTAVEGDPGLTGPAAPLVGVGIVPPGLPVVQQATARQVVRVIQQPMLLGIVGAAYRHHVFIHQRVDGEPLRHLVVEIDRQIDAITVQVDVLVAGHDVEIDLGMQAGEIREPRHQPALGDGGAGVDGQGTGQLLILDLQDLLIDELKRRLECPEDPLPLSRQHHLAVKALEQLEAELLFQRTYPVAHRARAERQLIRRQGEGAVTGRRLEGVQLGELIAAQQLVSRYIVVFGIHPPSPSPAKDRRHDIPESPL